ncbi:MAG: LEA type 2 family protein [Halobacteriaceae archaeon]
MGLLRRLAKALLGLTLLIGIGLGGAYAGGIIAPPTAAVEDVGDWGNVTEDRTEVVTTIQVQNPNPVGLSYGGVGADYTLYLNDVAVANGSKQGVDIKPGNNTIELTTYIRNENLGPWWANYVENNETITTHVDGRARVSVGPLSGGVGFPNFERTLQSNSTPVRDALTGAAASMEGTYTINRSVSVGGFERTVTAGYVVERGWATWGEATVNETTVVFHYRIHNPSQSVPVPAVPDGLAATIETNDVALLNASGDEFEARNVATNATIAPGETRHVAFAVQMDNDRVDDWFRSHVRNEELTRVEAQFRMVFDVQGQTIRVPRDGGTAYTCRFQTGILVDGQATTSTCGQEASVTPA